MKVVLPEEEMDVVLKKQSLTVMLAVILSSQLSGCGGGGGNGTSTPVTPGTGGGNSTVVEPVWQAGVYAPEATYKNYCAAPRTQPDPTTGRVYQDQKGTAMHEKMWLRSWSNNTYLWYRELPDPNPANYTVAAYFATQRTTAITASGKPKDEFHFSEDTAAYNKEQVGGVRSGYGISWQISSARPPRQVMVRYTEPNSPAALAGLNRGARLVKVDGVDVVNDDSNAGVDKINAGIFPRNNGETHELVFVDAQGREQSYTLRSADVTVSPVQNVKVLNQNGKKVGYMQFNTYIASAQPLLINAVNQFKTENISELVVDLRYNGGGLLALSAQLGHMVTGSAIHQNRTFEVTKFNDKHPRIDPHTNRVIQPLPFIGVEIDYRAGEVTSKVLPSLNLNRIVVLASGSTCSASEAFINGLRGIDVEVVLVVGKTCGKPYGFYPTDNCSTTYFTVQFQGVNAKGFGDFADGFRPMTTPVTETDVKGCPATDDFSKLLGDPTENMLRTALHFLGTNSCPVGAEVAAAPLPVGDGPAIDTGEPRWQQESIRIPLKNL